MSYSSKSALCAVCKNYDTDGEEYSVKENEIVCSNCDVDDCVCNNCDCPDWLPDIPKEILFAVDTDEDQEVIAKVNGIAKKKKKPKVVTNSDVSDDEANEFVKFHWSDDENEETLEGNKTADATGTVENVTEKTDTPETNNVAPKPVDENNDLSDIFKDILNSDAKTGEIVPKRKNKIDTNESKAINKDEPTAKATIDSNESKSSVTKEAENTAAESSSSASDEKTKATSDANLTLVVPKSVDPVSDTIAQAHEKQILYNSKKHLYTEVVMPSKQRENITVPQAEVAYKKWKCGSKSQLITLMPTGDLGKREYEIIAREMENTRKYHFSGHFSGYRISKIQKIVNPCLWRRYRTAKKIIADECEPNERLLFHGSSKWEIIIDHGFDEKYAKLSGMFGAGIYFTSVSSKSNQYTLGVGDCIPHKKKNCFLCERRMLLCRVVLGKTKEFTTSKHIAKAPEGYHSVEGGVTTFGLQYNEFIVYKKEQVYPEYLITYKLK